MYLSTLALVLQVSIAVQNIVPHWGFYCLAHCLSNLTPAIVWPKQLKYLGRRPIQYSKLPFLSSHWTQWALPSLQQTSAWLHFELAISQNILTFEIIITLSSQSITFCFFQTITFPHSHYNYAGFFLSLDPSTFLLMTYFPLSLDFATIFTSTMLWNLSLRPQSPLWGS